jgi:hypothetical protein
MAVNLNEPASGITYHSRELGENKVQCTNVGSLAKKRILKMMAFFVIILFLVIPGQFIYAFEFNKVFIYFYEHDNEKKLFLMIGFVFLSMFFLSVLYSYLVGYTYIFKIFLYISTLLAIVFWFFLALKNRARFILVSKRKTNSTKSLILYLVIAYLFFPSSYVLPYYGSRLFNSSCDAIHRESGNQIYSAIQNYRTENGKYPNELDQLVPEYLPDIPIAVCFPVIRFLGIKPQRYDFLTSNHDYKIISCSQKTFLVVEDMNHSHPQVMNLEIGIWSYLVFDTLDYGVDYSLCGPQ